MDIICKCTVPDDFNADDVDKKLRKSGIVLNSIKQPVKSTIVRKGSQWEREFAKQLSLWFTDGKDGFVFERRSGSGGSQRDKNLDSGEAGDIFAVKPEGKLLTDKLVFELKFYRDLTPDLWAILSGERSKRISDWWEKLKKESDLNGKKACLVLRTNRKRPVMLTNALSWFYDMVPEVWVYMGLDYVRLIQIDSWFGNEVYKARALSHAAGLINARQVR